jgi:UDP-N-acetyl-2-amino-2-deoxyglucuronate dehydrogenase
VRVGIIGGGAGGELCAQGIRQVDGLFLAGMAGGSRAATLADKYDVRAYPSVDALLLDRSVDVVAVASPSHLHAAHAAQALNCGKHAIVEKPIALDVHDASELVDLSKSAEKRLMVMHQYRYDPAHRFVHDVVAGGLASGPITVRAELEMSRGPSYFSEVPWRSRRDLGGGVVWNQALHLWDLLLWWLGPLTPEQITLSTSTHTPGVDESIVGLLRSENGHQAQVRATTGEGSPHLLDICVDGPALQVRVRDHGLSSWGTEDPGLRNALTTLCADLDADQPAWPPARGHAAAFADFQDWITSGEPPLIEIQAGPAVVQLVTDLFEAARPQQGSEVSAHTVPGR